MKVVTELTGTTPYIPHNIRLARPDDEFTKAIAHLTSKRSKKTDEDRLEISRLEFCGSLYIDAGGPYIPAANIRRCFIEAARIRRKGKSVERALIPAQMAGYLEYKGPRDANGLWEDERYRYSAVVTVNRAKTPRMRPQFPEWSLSLAWELLTDTLDLDDLEEIVRAAGFVEGLGDNRTNGFGRFTASVTSEQ